MQLFSEFKKCNPCQEGDSDPPFRSEVWDSFGSQLYSPATFWYSHPLSWIGWLFLLWPHLCVWYVLCLHYDLTLIRQKTGKDKSQMTLRLEINLCVESDFQFKILICIWLITSLPRNAILSKKKRKDIFIGTFRYIHIDFRPWTYCAKSNFKNMPL